MRVTFRGYLVASMMFGGAFLAWRGFAHDDDVRPHDDIGGVELANIAPPVEPPPLAASTDDGSMVQAAAAPLPAQVFSRDDYPQGWDELASGERMQHLEGRFTAALEAIEGGEQPIAKHVFVAESALTSMRAELYGSAAGRAKHRSHESRLDRALGEATPGNEGATK